MGKFVPSKYNLRIFEEFDNTLNNIIISATAGAGKTTTLIQLFKRVPEEQDAIFLAFNKSITEELRSRLPKHVHCSTIHSFGCRTLFQHFPGIKIDENKYFKLALMLYNQSWKEHTKEKAWYYCYRISKLVELACLTMTLESDKLEALANEYDIDIVGNEIEDAIELYDAGYNNMAKMNFSDMVHQIAIRKIKLKKYDIVAVDECLPYHMPVLLADGSSKPIGEIVENKLTVEVLSYNTKTKKQEKCQITNWSRTYNDKKLFKIKAGFGTYAITNSFIVCSYNHKIWADGKWIEAQYIKPGMIIQFETSAEKTQKYKITKEGSEVVKKTMIKKNNSYSKEKRIGMARKCNKENFNKIKGGNGRINQLQEDFLNKLEGNWVSEFPVPTLKKRNSGYPTCYKIDIANPDLMIGIELDGNSHNDPEVKKRDLKKDSLLKEFGWNIIRIKNRELIKDFENFYLTINEMCNDISCDDGENCPIDLKVISIDEMDVKEKYLYDISVQGCHNFYANGILVHNCQDLNAAQQAIVKKLVKPGVGRLIGVGDPSQAIYGFSGADFESYDKFKTMLPDTTLLPLSICYRCPQEVIKLAKEVVPTIEASPDAPKGKVDFNGKIDDIEGDCFVIARNTKPLVLLFRELIRAGKKAHIKGRDIGKNLASLISRTKAVTIEQLLTRLAEQRILLKEKLFKKRFPRPDEHPTMIKLVEKIEIIKILSEDNKTISSLINRIEEIFKDDEIKGICLSTIHKIKGMENDKVWFLNRHLIPSQYAKTKRDLIQEQNLLFVALTRSKKELIFVNI